MYLQAIIAAVIAAAAASSSWWLTRDHYLGVIADAKVKAAEQIDAANTKANNAAIDWEAWAAVQKPAIVYRDRKVAAAFKAEPAWAAASIPASVRVLLDAPAAGSAPDPAVADYALSPASAPRAGDQPGSGAGVPGVQGFFGRLFKASPSAGAGSAAQP